MSQPFDYVAPFAQAAQLPTPDIGGSFLQGINQSITQRYGVQQMQVQMAQQQQALAAQQAALADPTPGNILKWGIADPSHYEAVKSSHDAMTSDAQKQDVQDAASIYGYLGAGDTDGAAKILQQRVDAGQSNLAPLLQAVQSGDPAKVKAAQATAGMILAGKMGPDKFAETYKAIGEEGRATAEEPGKIALTAAQTAEANANAQVKLHPLPETAATTGADGSPVFYDRNAPPPAGAAGGVSGSPALSALVPKLIGSESNFDPNAKNPNSSATGAGQFLSGTWVPLFKQLHPDIAAGKTDQQILAMRSNPQYAAEGVAAYAQQNAAALGNSGLPVNGATLAMAHKLGPGGAQSVLNAAPNAPLSTVLPAEVIKANPQLAKLTAGQYAGSLAKQFGTDPINTAADPSATGDDFLATLSPGRAKLVKAIANGDAPMPTGRSATTGAGQALMQQVLQYDPSANSFNLQTRQATRKAFTTGTEGQAINSANTVIGHLVGLNHAIDGLQNTNLSWVNGPAQFLGQNLGNTQTQKAVANFNFYRTAVANELTKVFRGSNGAEADVQGWLKQLNSAGSPVELHQTVQAMVDGMKSRLESLGAQYNSGMQKNIGPLELLTPHSRALLATLEGGGDGGSPKVAINPQTGQRLVYDAASRAWKPS